MFQELASPHTLDTLAPRTPGVKGLSEHISSIPRTVTTRHISTMQEEVLAFIPCVASLRTCATGLRRQAELLLGWPALLQPLLALCWGEGAGQLVLPAVLMLRLCDGQIHPAAGREGVCQAKGRGERATLFPRGQGGGWARR